MARRTNKRFWLFQPLPVVAVCFFAFSAWFVFGKSGLWNSSGLRSEKHAQQEQICLLEERKQLLQEYLADLRVGDELALDRAARARGFVGQGETIYKIEIESAKK
ncbi:septum formation initiator family protein [bacterium]|nr:septum formation initiator family protein [bacterium]MBU1983632.1 septum formation initiator family protein [bacterium]